MVAHATRTTAEQVPPQATERPGEAVQHAVAEPADAAHAPLTHVVAGQLQVNLADAEVAAEEVASTIERQRAERNLAMSHFGELVLLKMSRSPNHPRALTQAAAVPADAMHDRRYLADADAELVLQTIRPTQARSRTLSPAIPATPPAAVDVVRR